MKCDEVRLRIEEIEDLRNCIEPEDEMIVSHLKSCSSCQLYWERTRVWEDALFHSVRQVRIPDEHMGKYERKKQFSALKVAIAALILICITLFLLVIRSKGSDNIRNMVSAVLSDSLPFQPVQADEFGKVLSQYSSQTGISVSLPETIPAHSVCHAAITEIDGVLTLVVRCTSEAKNVICFIYPCSDGLCYTEKQCVREQGCRVEQWHQGNMAYTLVYR